VVLKKTFYFEIVLDLQKVAKNSTENSFIFYPTSLKVINLHNHSTIIKPRN